MWYTYLRKQLLLGEIQHREGRMEEIWIIRRVIVKIISSPFFFPKWPNPPLYSPSSPQASPMSKDESKEEVPKRYREDPDLPLRELPRGIQIPLHNWILEVAVARASRNGRANLRLLPPPTATAVPDIDPSQESGLRALGLLPFVRLSLSLSPSVAAPPRPRGGPHHQLPPDPLVELRVRRRLPGLHRRLRRRALPSCPRAVEFRRLRPPARR